MAHRSRDLMIGCARLREAHTRLRFYVESRNCELLGRVFHAMPGRQAPVSLSPLLRHEHHGGGDARQMLHLGSYNYSGLNGHARIVGAAAAALQRYGTTASGVRVLNGTCDLHLELERRLAEFLGYEDCITYSSGYLANVSVLSTLCGPEDVVLSDMLNHRSIVDGLELSRASVRTYRHKSARSLDSMLSTLPREQRKFIITDGVFSMDGDVADLPAIVDLAERYNAFVVLDDAHGTAAIGPCGRGTAASFGLESQVDLVTGSLSKGLPGIGGFAAGSRATVELLRCGSNGYIFSASLPPPIVAGLIEAIGILEEQPEIQERLHHKERYLRDGIRSLGMDCLNSESPIIPVMMPSHETALELARVLHHEGIYVNPVGPPAVSKNRTRLRLNASANLEQADLDRFLDVLERHTQQLGIRSVQRSRAVTAR